jgi:hypothetical protein
MCAHRRRPRAQPSGGQGSRRCDGLGTDLTRSSDPRPSPAGLGSASGRSAQHSNGCLDDLDRCHPSCDRQRRGRLNPEHGFRQGLEPEQSGGDIGGLTTRTWITSTGSRLSRPRARNHLAARHEPEHPQEVPSLRPLRHDRCLSAGRPGGVRRVERTPIDRRPTTRPDRALGRRVLRDLRVIPSGGCGAGTHMSGWLHLGTRQRLHRSERPRERARGTSRRCWGQAEQERRALGRGCR